MTDSIFFFVMQCVVDHFEMIYNALFFMLQYFFFVLQWLKQSRPSCRNDLQRTFRNDLQILFFFFSGRSSHGRLAMGTTLEKVITLQHTATHRNTLQHTDSLQHTTLEKVITLQHTATHRNTKHQTATHCNTLQHTTTHCNTLQHTATHCNSQESGEYWMLRIPSLLRLLSVSCIVTFF